MCFSGYQISNYDKDLEWDENFLLGIRIPSPVTQMVISFLALWAISEQIALLYKIVSFLNFNR